MAKSNSFNKREVEKNKQQKRKEKLEKKTERKNNPTNSFDDMIAYVDENGVITDTPPTQRPKHEVDLEDIVISVPKREDVDDPILNGRVEFFNPDKGYGFIKQIGTTDKFFFHISNAPAGLIEGNMITFELERGQKGMNAVNIVLANKKAE